MYEQYRAIWEALGNRAGMAACGNLGRLMDTHTSALPSSRAVCMCFVTMDVEGLYRRNTPCNCIERLGKETMSSRTLRSSLKKWPCARKRGLA